MPLEWARTGGFARTLRLYALILLAGCSSPRSARTPSDLNHTGPLQEEISVDLGAVERRVHLLVNEERNRRHLHLFRNDEALVELARSHSTDMAANDFFDHTNLRGETPTQRGEVRGIECIRPAGDSRVAIGIGENIFSTYLFFSFHVLMGDGETQRSYDWKSIDDLAAEAVDGWMNSRGHRLNLLSRQYRTMGIGAAYDVEGKLFLTQNFC